MKKCNLRYLFLNEMSRFQELQDEIIDLSKDFDLIFFKDQKER
jgi:hypothetical protein